MKKYVIQAYQKCTAVMWRCLSLGIKKKVGREENASRSGQEGFLSKDRVMKAAREEERANVPKVRARRGTTLHKREIWMSFPTGIYR